MAEFRLLKNYCLSILQCVGANDVCANGSTLRSSPGCRRIGAAHGKNTGGLIKAIRSKNRRDRGRLATINYSCTFDDFRHSTVEQYTSKSCPPSIFQWYYLIHNSHNPLLSPKVRSCRWMDSLCRVYHTKRKAFVITVEDL